MDDRLAELVVQTYDMIAHAETCPEPSLCEREFIVSLQACRTVIGLLVEELRRK